MPSTSAAVCQPVSIGQPSGTGIGPDDTDVEIDQVAVVQPSPLRGIDAMRIVARRAGDLLGQVHSMLREALVAQDAVSTVALIAQFVGQAAFLREIGRLIPIGQEMGVHRAMGAFGPGRAVGIVAVGAVDQGGDRQGRFQAGNVLACPVVGHVDVDRVGQPSVLRQIAERSLPKVEHLHASCADVADVDFPIEDRQAVGRRYPLLLLGLSQDELLESTGARHAQISGTCE